MTGNSIMENTVNLNLPAFAFVEGSDHEDNILKGRNVILHIRSASVIEIFERDNVNFNEGTLIYNFSYLNFVGFKEPMVAALHYSATLDVIADRDMIKKEILKPAAKWYCDYQLWVDNNLIK